ncbi:MAG: SPASM domain-containing protein [Prevotellamassilia sp.]
MLQATCSTCFPYSNSCTYEDRAEDFSYDIRKSRYGDKNNTAVINYNGDVFKCTARNFTKTHREGILSPEGEVIWNEQNELRRSLNYGTTTCKRCKIYPICHGGVFTNKVGKSPYNGLLQRLVTYTNRQVLSRPRRVPVSKVFFR